MENKTFKGLNAININDKVKTKMNLSYLSWAYAWGELLSKYPDSFMTVYKRTVDTTETVTQEDPDNHITKTIVTSENTANLTDEEFCNEYIEEIKDMLYLLGLNIHQRDLFKGNI